LALRDASIERAIMSHRPERLRNWRHDMPDGRKVSMNFARSIQGALMLRAEIVEAIITSAEHRQFGPWSTEVRGHKAVGKQDL